MERLKKAAIARSDRRPPSRRAAVAAAALPPSLLPSDPLSRVHVGHAEYFIGDTKVYILEHEFETRQLLQGNITYKYLWYLPILSKIL